MLSGGILGTFAIMITSLSWLVVAYDVQFEGGPTVPARHLIYFAAFVVLLLCTSS
jgi:hypothetical protein